MEKTYVFDTADKGGFDSTALIASLMGNRGVDPNLMALIQNASKNQDAWGGGGMWWIWVIIMFWLWGGNGSMFGRNGMADGIPNQLNNGFGREVLLQAINGNGTALSQLATTLNCDVNALQTAIGQVQSSIQSIANQVGMTTGTPRLVETTVFIPVKAVITVVTQNSQCGCNAHTQLFTENFVVAFQGQTALPTAVTLTNVGRDQFGSNINCGCAFSYTINDSLTLAITPAA